MKIPYLLLTGGLLTLAGSACAQQPAAGSTPPDAAAAAAAAPTPADAAEVADASNFSLLGNTAGATHEVSSHSAAMAPYEISGNGIGGSRGASQAILTAPVPERGAPIRAQGGIFLYPSVFVGYGYNDNLLRSGINRLGSSLINTSPQVLAEMKRHGDRYTAVILSNRTDYSNSSIDNFSNYEAWLAGDNYFSARARMGWAFGEVKNTDPRGSTLRPAAPSPDRWHAPTLRGKFIYGAPEAAGRIEVEADDRRKRYDNNHPITDVADLNEQGLTGRFFYRLGSRSLALVEASRRVFDYTATTATSDNTDRRLYLGYTWEASAASTGIIKFGHMNKRYAQPGHDQFSGSTWEAIARWRPRTYSTLEFALAKAAEDATGIGSYVLSTRNSLSWKHQWSTRFSTDMAVNLNKTKYIGANRSDDLRGFSWTARYNLRRWLTTGIDFADTALQSSDATAPWRRKVIMFTVNFTL